MPAELDIEITYKQMIATSLTVTVDEGCSLPHPVECSVTPSDSSLNKDISLFWLFPNGSEVPSDGRIRQRSHVTQMLWILTASFGKDSGYYACRYTTNKKHRSTGFSLNVRGKYIPSVMALLLDDLFPSGRLSLGRLE